MWAASLRSSSQQGTASVAAQSRSSKKRRKSDGSKAVPTPRPKTEAAAKGVALGAAVAAQHPDAVALSSHRGEPLQTYATLSA